MKKNRNTLYLDMDGVVADFDRYAHETLGLPPSNGKYSPEEWSDLSKNPRIYLGLQKTPYADRLVDACRKFCKEREFDLKFLTAIPKGNDIPWAFNDKVTWALFFYPDIPVMFGPYSKDKHLHCRMNDILIDDRLSNIREWSGKFGYAIHHKSIEETLDELAKYQPYLIGG